MERWNVFPCRGDRAGFYLLNKNRTSVKINSRCSWFDIGAFLAALEEAQFPLKFTDGLDLINFTYIAKGRMYGRYSDDTIEIDIRFARRQATIVDTFVHEVAHHIDSENDISSILTAERKLCGRYVHSYARGSDDEYLARGFELFYSHDPRRRRRLRLHCPHLYRVIQRLDRRYRKDQ